MAESDRAIIVGIQKYPFLGDLGGPENDTQAFFDWVRSSAGGAVPEANVRRILATIPNPRYADPVRPVTWEVEEAFEELADLAQANRAAGRPMRVGRRLYIYLAGHGFEPQRNFTALLTANATPYKTGHHILGKPYAEYFAQGAIFDEIVLLVDCCREQDYLQVPLNLPRLTAVTASADALDRVRYFHAFGARWKRKTRERPLTAGGPVRGVFTLALLQGLTGGAADPNTGQITARSLGDFLYENMASYLEPADLADPEIAKTPEIDYDPKDGALVLATMVPIPQFPVTFRLTATAGQRLRILGSQFQLVQEVPWAGAPLVVNLRRGMYLAQVGDGGPPKVFEVQGTGGVDVTV